MNRRLRSLSAPAPPLSHVPGRDVRPLPLSAILNSLSSPRLHPLPSPSSILHPQSSLQPSSILNLPSSILAPSTSSILHPLSSHPAPRSGFTLPELRARPAFTLPQLRARPAFTLPQPRARLAFTSRERRGRHAFTLIELMVVIGIIAVLTTLLVPAFTGLKKADDVTAAAYDIKGVLEQARVYATSRNTYVWIGFFEENVSASSTVPATAGTGRVVISVVASRDGTTVYDPDSSLNPDPIDPTRLIQVNKLLKIDNAHLAIFADGDGTSNNFDTRPPVGTNLARFGNVNALPVGSSAPSTNTKFPFSYPLNGPPPSQYVFLKTLQINPRGESIVNSTYAIRRHVEVGLQPTHGTIIDSTSRNLVAIQVTGVGSDVKLYRR